MEELKITMTTDGKHAILVDEKSDDLVKVTFYDIGLTDDEKVIISNKMREAVSEIKTQRIKNNSESHDWAAISSAFKDAYKFEPKKKGHITWLMTTILGISSEEADRRWEIGQELMTHPDFKDKEDVVVDKIYLNKSAVPMGNKRYEYFENRKDRFPM